jgi:hypothetical protein
MKEPAMAYAGIRPVLFFWRILHPHNLQQNTVGYTDIFKEIEIDGDN